MVHADLLDLKDLVVNEEKLVRLADLDLLVNVVREDLTEKLVRPDPKEELESLEPGDQAEIVVNLGLEESLEPQVN